MNTTKRFLSRLAKLLVTGVLVFSAVPECAGAPTGAIKTVKVTFNANGGKIWLFCIIRKMLRTRVADDPT